MARELTLPLVMTRRSTRDRDFRAGCYVCSGSTARWTAANAQALAAKHHDRTDHATWCTIHAEIRYGRTEADPRQHDIEDAIAFASSGGAPDCASLTEFDAPADTAAGVSAPEGRSSKPALTAAKPEIHAS